MSSERKAPVIAMGSRVTLHFSLALTDGKIIDSNFDRAAPSFRLGDGSLLPGFEQCLLGLQQGDEREFMLAPEQAFGQPNTANHQSFTVANFRHLLEDDLLPLAPGTVVSFKDAAGFDLPGVVMAIGEDRVEVDFNHPLAGKSIRFRVRVVNVLDADAQPVAIKL